MEITHLQRAEILCLLHSQGIVADDAEDALQDACIRQFITQPTLEEESELISWVLTVARRRLIDQHRHEQAFAFAHVDDRLSSRQPGDRLSSRQPGDRLSSRHVTVEVGIIERLSLESILSGLTDEERWIIECKADGWNCREIADGLMVSEDAAKKHLQRIRSRLKRILSI